jgi:DNA-binding response OmpR family regulator
MRIAIVADESELALLVDALDADGHACHSYQSSAAFVSSVTWEQLDACVIAHNSPSVDSKEVLERIRKLSQPLPALVLTESGNELYIASLFDNGNNDFQVKPLQSGELRARLAALARRVVPAANSHMLFAYDRFEFNLKTLEVKAASVPVLMTQKEFQLALLLMGNIGKALSRGDIREAIWGRNSEVPSRTLDTHVSRVRTKLGLRPGSGYLLSPLYSFGYRLERFNIH